MTINLQGVRQWSWLQTPITLHWKIDVTDGSSEFDVSILTVQGVSSCSSTSFPSLTPIAQSSLPADPAVQVLVSGIFDNLSLVDTDYCGPQALVDVI